MIQRLINRGSEDKEKILNRLETAQKECDAISLYDSVLLNETKEKSLKRLENLIEHEERIIDDFDVNLFKKQIEKQGILNLRVKEWIFSLDDEIQKMFYEEYGENPQGAFEVFIENGIQLEEVLQWFSKLYLMQQRVFLLRHTYGTGQIRTYEQIAEKYNIRSERIKQCELQAIWKWKHRYRPIRNRKRILE